VQPTRIFVCFPKYVNPVLLLKKAADLFKENLTLSGHHGWKNFCSQVVKRF
jgi:hypothetical protein